jgi:hypothetical protein
MMVGGSGSGQVLSLPPTLDHAASQIPVTVERLDPGSQRVHARATSNVEKRLAAQVVNTKEHF